MTDRKSRIGGRAIPRVALAVAALIGIAGMPAAAAASPEDAQALADQAYAAYQHEDWTRAISLYLESYKQVPTADILYNVAKIYDGKLGEGQLAAEYYRRYTLSPDAEPSLVRKSVGRIAELGAKDKAPTPVTAGAASSKQDKPTEQSSPWRPVGYAVGGAGLVGVAVGAAFGFVAIGQSNAAKSEHCVPGGCSGSAATDERNAANNGNLSTAFLVAGGALAAAGVALVLFTRKSSVESPGATPKGAALRLTPTAAPGAVGLTISGVLF
jgi:hypothetical protein